MGLRFFGLAAPGVDRCRASWLNQGFEMEFLVSAWESAPGGRRNRDLLREVVLGNMTGASGKAEIHQNHSPSS